MLVLFYKNHGYFLSRETDRNRRDGIIHHIFDELSANNACIVRS